MSSILDVIIGFVAALLSAAFLHFGAGGAKAPDQPKPSPPVETAASEKNQVTTEPGPIAENTAHTEITTVAEDSVTVVAAPAKPVAPSQKWQAPAAPKAPQPPVPVMRFTMADAETLEDAAEADRLAADADRQAHLADMAVAKAEKERQQAQILATQQNVSAETSGPQCPDTTAKYRPQNIRTFVGN